MSPGSTASAQRTETRVNALTWLVDAGADKRVGAVPLSQENGQLHGAVSVGKDHGENSSTGGACWDCWLSR